ncbi:hypothetical protein A8709_21935 [Paenibacillus pectinilyticus]|uniref:Uncharacterized protein n=1 Tax=Paenibacillus pectinilyticus TaxID=512399 RepID=A0A1C0ZXY1_9BACL|nr:hypothetical protein [Paenibacillus pectinilyticus]OCT12986.1 hypothetical protein A8709_21935 [Paenibacillus pectinilyticus]
MHTSIRSVLTVIVMAGLLSVAVVNDVSSRKELSLPIFKQNATVDHSTWLASPEPLFDEKNNAKLKPLLGLMSGAVALEYYGPQPTLAVSFEYWKDGVLERTSPGMSITMMDEDKDAQGNYRFNGDFVYEFKDHGDPSGKLYSELAYALIDQRASYSATLIVDKPADIGITGEMKLQLPVQAPRTEGIIVWGLQGTNKQSMFTLGSISETLQQAQWAMVIRLGFTDQISGPSK